MGGPISIMDRLNPAQFEIGCILSHGSIGPERPDLYRRIVIRHLSPQLPEEVDIAALLAAYGIFAEVAAAPPPVEANPAYARCACSGPAMVDGRTVARKRKEMLNHG